MIYIIVVTKQLGMRTTSDGTRHRSDSATAVVPAKYNMLLVLGIILLQCQLFTVNLSPPQLGWGPTNHGSLVTAKTRNV